MLLGRCFWVVWILISTLILFILVNCDGPEYVYPPSDNSSPEEPSEGSPSQEEAERNRFYSIEEDCDFKGSKCGLLNKKGLESVEDFGRIIGGNRSLPNRFPWIVLLIFRNKETKMTSYCGGTIINDRWILSAAHCWVDEKTGKRLKTLVRVKPMIYHYSSKKSCEDLDIFDNKIFYPKEYFNKKEKKVRDEFDILLIKTKERIEFTEKIRPVCMCSKPLKSKSIDKDNCFVAGFGRIHKHFEGSDVLKEARVNISKVCEENMVCANGKWIGKEKSEEPGYYYSPKQHEGTCQGDSGSALVCPLSDDRKRFVIVGDVSFNLEEGPKGEGCGWGGAPTRFASIDFLKKRFIDKTLNNDDKDESSADSESSSSSPDNSNWGRLPSRPTVGSWKRDWPWIVSIRIESRRRPEDDRSQDDEFDVDNKDGRRSHRCTGTLLTRSWVLTTATCLGLHRLKITEIDVFGVVDYEDVTGDGKKAGQSIRPMEVKRVVLHPNFNPQAEMTYGVYGAYNDLALVKIKDLNFGETTMAPVSWRPDAKRQIKRSCFIGRQTQNVHESFIYLERVIEGGRSCRVKNFNDVVEYCLDKPGNEEDQIAMSEVDGKPDCSTGNAGGPLMCRLTSDPEQSLILAGVVKADFGCSPRNTKLAIALNLDRYISLIINITMTDFDKEAEKKEKEKE